VGVTPAGGRLPIDDVLPQVVSAVRDHGAVVLHAPTGAGKTTRVPPALLDALDPSGLILVLEPRRVAARAAASRMAWARGEPVGQTIGFQVRHERAWGPLTRILVVTEGVLLRRLVDDPFLEDVGLVVLDEVHERSLDSDLALGILRQIRADLRPELRLLAMSATADVDRLATFLDARIVRSEGRSYPIELRYLGRPVLDPVRAAAEHAPALAEEVDGDLLVFLPGVREIRQVEQDLVGRTRAEVVPLHGRLPPADQDRALRAGDRQRIVLATNVAETSVTLPSVRAVLDTGLVRVLRHDPRRGLDQLVVEPTSRASADQRAGRAGRTAPGVALRLWTERQHAQRPAHDQPEVRRADLAAAVLTLHAWGAPDALTFPWFEAPPSDAVRAAEHLLTTLGALQAGQLTPIGRQLVQLPTHPRLARALIAAHQHGATERTALAVALLTDRVPAQRTAAPRQHSPSDLEDLLEALASNRAGEWTLPSPGALQQARTAARQLSDLTRRLLGPERASTPDGLRRALLAGFPDRLARRRADGSDRLLLATGRGARLHPHSAVRQAPLLLALDVLDTDEAEAVVHLASEVEVGWLPTRREIAVRYDVDRDRVVASEHLVAGGLRLETREGVEAPADSILHALHLAAKERPARALPRDDAELTRLVARIAFLARARPDLELPPTEESDLLDLVPRLGGGLRSLDELRGADWSGALLDLLSWEQRRTLDALAPDRIEVPSGSLIRLDYPEEGPPVLAVRMQEMFGTTRTPQVAGRPVLLHLLAPNQRPAQITDDLAGFWSRTWPEVRKELRRRYPKHAWPDDPTTAPAQRRPGRPPTA
jgi:ATP-dependent helicase HrpB